METMQGSFHTHSHHQFKSYYVVWKLSDMRRYQYSDHRLNRTM